MTHQHMGIHREAIAQLAARQEELEEELTRRQEEYQAISLAWRP